MRRMLSLAVVMAMLLSCCSAAYADHWTTPGGCEHTFTAYSTGEYRCLWYNEKLHKKYEIFIEVCTKCGYLYRNSYAEIGSFLHQWQEGSLEEREGDMHLSDSERHMFFYICPDCFSPYGIIYKDCHADTTNAHVTRGYRR